jgi:hypothetical protein
LYFVSKVSDYYYLIIAAKVYKNYEWEIQDFKNQESGLLRSQLRIKRDSGFQEPRTKNQESRRYAGWFDCRFALQMMHILRMRQVSLRSGLGSWFLTLAILNLSCLQKKLLHFIFCISDSNLQLLITPLISLLGVVIFALLIVLICVGILRRRKHIKSVINSYIT